MIARVGRLANGLIAQTKNIDWKETSRLALTELGPPRISEIPAAIRQGINLTRGNWRNVTVREAWLNCLVTTEVICWFFVGEVIGKGTLIGYQV